MHEKFAPVTAHQVLFPEELSEAIRRADFEPCQLSASSAMSRVARAHFPRVCLDFAELGPAMLFKGRMPDRFHTMIFVLECPEKGRAFNLNMEHTEGYMGFFPPGCPMDSYTPEGYSNASLTVPADLFLTMMGRMYPEVPEGRLSRPAGLRLGRRDDGRLRRVLATAKRMLLDAENPFAGELVRRQMEGDLLEAYLSALASGLRVPLRNGNRRVAGRIDHLRQARELVISRVGSDLRVQDLCEELGMSARGLELLFQESIGIGPNAFIRNQRLHAVRRALLRSEPGSGAVKESAMKWGFWHMGHFSIRYRELFGEKPSETLMRGG